MVALVLKDKPMKLRQMSALLDSTSHYFWRAHAYVVSRQTPSVLPPDLIFIILRYVPSWPYLDLYDPEPTPDCELQFDPWQHTDIDEPRAFGDY